MVKNKTLQKAERESLNIKDKLLEKLKVSAPEVFAEGRVNWDKLRRALGDHLETSADKFNFTWAGKAQAVANVLIPSKATLKPDKKESLKFETSENLFIEGDNLEVLKLLQKSYFEQIKMIYIDPPYNTGNDFVYKDDFRQPLKNYLEQSGQVDNKGNRLSTNTQASGRFHSDWLTMMYSRLKLAWNLLRHDGVIFVSIDDNEVHHLRMMMDEIFGEENFVQHIIWNSKYTVAGDATTFSSQHEHVLCYARNYDECVIQPLPRTEEMDAAYKNSDNDKRGAWKPTPLHAKSGNKNYKFIFKNGKTWTAPPGRWPRFSVDTLRRLDEDNRIWFGSDGKSTPNVKTFLSEVKAGKTPGSVWKYDEVGHTHLANEQLADLLGKGIFDNPKPIGLIKRCLQLSIGSNDIVLDFFAGSATTAHAVLAQNQEDGGNRKFILVQMPEPIDPKSEAHKAGYKTIADIAKERIRRVLKGYGEHKPIDDGFKVFKLDKSNYSDNFFEYDPEKSDEENEKAFKDYLNKAQKELFPTKINEMDIVYENIIKEGLNLNARIDEIKIGKSKFYKVTDGERELFICLEEKLDDGVIDLLTAKEYKEKIFICFDGALTDSDKANLALSANLKTI